MRASGVVRFRWAIRIKRREIEAEIRYFAENLVARWQSNVCWRSEIVLKGKNCGWGSTVVWVRECERQWLAGEYVVGDYALCWSGKCVEKWSLVLEEADRR